MALYFLMILSAGGMIWANGKYKKDSAAWGRPLAGMCGILTLSFALVKIVSVFTASEKQQEMIADRELTYAHSTMQYLGSYIATNHPGARILLIKKPVSAALQARQEIMMRGLKKGLDGKSLILAKKTPGEPLTPGAPIEIESVYTAEWFNGVVKSHAECNLILSLVGLPWDLDKLEIWGMEPEQRPKLVTAFGSVSALKLAIKGDFITAAVTYNRTYRNNVNVPVPADVTEAFNARYVLINKENVDQIDQENPGTFKKIADPEDDE